MTNQKTVIAPTRVTYTAGQSVLDAIESSGFDFKFQGGDKASVETIEGVSANFVRFHDYTIGDNDYDLSGSCGEDQRSGLYGDDGAEQRLP